ncbi:hypothetical protein VPH35_118233 [Triticum aestivum]
MCAADDGERIKLKLQWLRYWLSVGEKRSNDMHLMTGSFLNLEGITPVDDSRYNAEESDTRADVVPEIADVCSNAPERDDPPAGLIISRSSGPGALLHLGRKRSSCTSVEHTCSRRLSSNSQMPDFTVVQGNNLSLLGQIDADIVEAESEFTEAEVRKRYLKHVEPQLLSRGLVLPGKLSHSTTAFVHRRTQEITGHRPKYMSILDVMGHEKRMKEDEWHFFLKDMIKTRVYVVENWSSSLCRVVSLTYDYGIVSPDEGPDVEFFKAECDAAYCEKKQQAELSFFIFKGKQIIHCQVHHEVPCRSSVVAECYAAAACLIKAKELGIENLVIYMDCKDSHGVLSGERNIRPDDVNMGVFLMLKKHQNALERVVPVWKERELNQLADDLVTLDPRTTLDPMFPQQAMERWKHPLEGYPVFRYKQKNEVETITRGFVFSTKKTVQAHKILQERSIALTILCNYYNQYLQEAKYFLLTHWGYKIYIVGKFDCLAGLLDGFDPDDLYVSAMSLPKSPKTSS